MREWKQNRFGELFLVPLRNGLTKPSRVRGTGIRMVNMKEIFGYDKIDDRVEMELVPVFKNEMGSMLQYDDLLFARQSLVESGAGKISIFKGKQKTVFESHLIRCRIDERKADPNFVYYLFKSPIGKGTVSSIVSQTAAAGIKGSDLQNLIFPFPSLTEQRAIAGVLSSLDDKIDLLHRQNKTLEGIAQALWRKMFIEMANPECKKGKLGDYGEFKNGINYSRNENGDSGYSIINVRDIVECKYVNTTNFEIVNIDRKKATPYLLRKGDIVIVRSASPGESLIVLEDVSNLIYSGFSIRLRCQDKKYSLFFFQFLQSYKKEMDIFSDGTTLKNINQGILNNIEVPVVEEILIEQFNEHASTIYERILSNQEQIKTLTQLRDTLLPKLMSGEARVKS